jgi:hypothetical protein
LQAPVNHFRWSCAVAGPSSVFNTVIRLSIASSPLLLLLLLLLLLSLSSYTHFLQARRWISGRAPRTRSFSPGSNPMWLFSPRTRGKLWGLWCFFRKELN